MFLTETVKLFNNMTDKLQIQIPEGYEIDTFDIKTGLVTFKKKPVERWIDKPGRTVNGYFIDNFSRVVQSICGIESETINRFATEKQAQSALAMAQLSQIIANDPRFGGPITDEEWKEACKTKYIISRKGNSIIADYLYLYYTFLAFHTSEQRDLFLEENMDLIKQYFML